MTRIHPIATSRNWGEAYDRLAAALPDMAAAAHLALCGMSACIDARISLDRMTALFASRDPQAKAFADMLLGRAEQGIGGEVRVDWPDGPHWLLAHETFDFALGGTGPQAAWTLATIGARALIALEDRSAHMLARVPGRILLVEDGRVVPRSQVRTHGVQRPDIYIIEYSKGVEVRGIVPPRSSRIIVRFGDPGLEHDDGFDGLSCGLAATAGTGLVSGFNCVPRGQLDDEIRRVFTLTRCWRAAGLQHVHLELAGYDAPELRDRVLAAAGGAVTSLGMSHSEFKALTGDGMDLCSDMIALGERMGIDRVCVHADEWAASVTLGDPAVEERALMTGCLLASSRAAAGAPVAPQGSPPGAAFQEPPAASSAGRGQWTFVSVASPHLATPAGTVGLGDTFTAGCLLGLDSGRLRPRAGD
jgi:ADP-dependent phosphofructokinase/glucokinase